VGVQGDCRTHSHVVALRAVTSSDGMTADWYPFEPKFLREVSTRICNKVSERALGGGGREVGVNEGWESRGGCSGPVRA
jgi:hypothetical protein